MILSACIQFHFQDSDEWQVAIDFVIVQAVSDDEFVRNVEADIVERNLDFATARFVEQSADLDRGWIAGLEHLGDVRKGPTCVDDIFDEQDIPV